MSSQGHITGPQGSPLAGAQVRVQGAPQSAFTDPSGRFVLRNVEEGEIELVVSYVGYEENRTRLDTDNLTDPLAISLNASSLVGLEEMLVTSQRYAINDALNRYRAADGISNYVSADDMGQFVDQNVAENLQRLPGISITRDQGEGRFVSVRGVSADLSTVTINGMRIGTPEDGSRAVPLDIVPSGSVDLLEINKVPTPDMPADAVGGSIDINSGSAFTQSGEARYDYRAELSHNELGGENNPAVGINLSDVLDFGSGTENLGITLGLNYQKRELQSDNFEAEYDYVDLGDTEVLVPIEVQQRKYFVNRERLGANLNLEFRADEDNRYFVDALFSRFNDAEVRQRSIFVLEDGDLVSFDGSEGRFENIAEDGFRRRIRNRTKEQDTFALGFRGEHTRDDLTLDYRLGHSITRESVPDEREGRFEKTGDPLDANFSMGSGIPMVNIMNGSTSDSTHLNNAIYELDRVVLEPIKVDDDDTNLALNADWSDAFNTAGFSIKAGVDMRFKTKDSNVDEVELRDVPALSLDQFETSAPSYGLGNLGQGISAADFMTYFESNREQFGQRPQDVDENRQLQLGQDFVADEDIYATYLMSTIDQGNWRFIAGVRAENTRYSATGNLLDFDSSGNLSVDSNSVESDYTNVLPGLHARYEPNDDLVVRFAWSNTIARPSFSDISPRFEINREDMEFETGNADLDPYEASNLDLLLDWYPSNRAVLSLGAFYKDIDNYAADFTSPVTTGDLAGFEWTRPVNSEDAQILGLEANAEMGLELFLPEMSGFLLGINATVLDTEFTLAERPGETFRLPQSAHSTANLYLGYESGQLSTRLSYSTRGKFLDEIGDSEEFDLYVADSQQLDLVFSYRLSDHINLRMEASNLLDDPLELYQGTKGNTLQFEEYGRTFSLGMTGRF